MTKLQVAKRDTKIVAAEVRAAGLVPAIMYGPKQEPISFSVKKIDMEKALKEAGESTIVELHEGSEHYDVLIHEVQFDPVSDQIVHVDFYAVEKGKKIKVHVPLEFQGVSPAEKTLGGILVKVMYEIEVEALPKDLPHEIVVDVTGLVDFESKITAADLVLPKGVELMAEPEEVVAAISEPQEEEPEEPATFNPDAIKVEEKGKKEEEAA